MPQQQPQQQPAAVATTIAAMAQYAREQAISEPCSVSVVLRCCERVYVT